MFKPLGLTAIALPSSTQGSRVIKLFSTIIIKNFLAEIRSITEDTNTIHTIITTRLLKLNEIMIGNYLQKKAKNQAE